MQVLLYALGGGNGHALRARQLATTLAERGARVHVLVPAGRAAAGFDAAVEVHPLMRCDDVGAHRARIVRVRDAIDPALVVVDTFPAGLLGELDAEFWLNGPAPRVLLARLHVRAATPGYCAAAARYTAVYDLEPHLRWLPSALAVRPVGPPLAPPPDPAPAARGVDVALAPGGDEMLRAFFGRLGARLLRAGIRAELATPRPPLGWASLAPRVVVGAAGFTLSYEAARARVWHVAIPRPRAYDDQARRAEAVAFRARDPHDVERQIKRLLGRGIRPAPRFSFGSFHALADALLGLRAVRGRPPGDRSTDHPQPPRGHRADG